MPDLEPLLREVRPVPDGAWAQRLDARVSARFPGPPPRWKAALERLRTHFMAIGAIGAVASLIVVFIAVGVSSNGSDDSGSSVSSSMKSPGPAVSDSRGASSGSAPATPTSGGESTASIAPQRAVRSSASLTLSTPSDQVATVTDRAIRVVDGLGGFVQTSEVNSVGATAGSTLALRVPSARLETALSQLSRLAHVKARSQQ